MSSDLYRVRVLAVDAPLRCVTLRVFSVYYDYDGDVLHDFGFISDASFFMRVLREDPTYEVRAPLEREVSLDELLDEAWVDANTHRFIERVARLSLRNDPPTKRLPLFISRHFTDEDVLKQADYKVVVTDAKWVEHLEVGMMWQTTSYATKAVMPRGRATVLVDVKEKKALVQKLRKAIGKRDLKGIRNAVAKGALLNPSYATFGDSALATAGNLVIEDGPEMRVIELLVELGADVNHRSTSDQSTPLTRAAYASRDVLARWLVAHGARLDGAALDNLTVLHCAAAGGLVWLVDRCIASGANPNAATVLRERPIHFAFTTTQWMPIAESLERAGADFQHQDEVSGTALHWAASHGLADAVPWLVARGIAVHTPSRTQHTPLMLAANCRAHEHASDTLRALLKLGADIDASTPEGVTALHIAAQNYSAEAVNALLAVGANKEARTTSDWRVGSTTIEAGASPIDVARRLQRCDAVLAALLD